MVVGFGADELVTATFNGISLNTSCITNGAGDCTIIFQVPAAVSAGTATVTATGMTSSVLASALFTVIAPTVILSAPSGAPGTSSRSA